MKRVRIAGRTICLLSPAISLGLLLIAAAAGGYFGVWGGWLRYHFYPKNWGVVEPGRIYRSGLIESGLIRKVLVDNHIRVMIQFNGRDLSDPKQAGLEQAARELNVEVRRFPMRGNGLPGDGGIGPYVKAIAAVHRARAEGKPVLLQCSAGANRTGAIVATYQLLVQGKSPEEVYEELCRHKHNPDDPRLLNHLNANMGAFAQKLLEMRVIDQMPEPIPTLGPAQAEIVGTGS